MTIMMIIVGVVVAAAAAVDVTLFAFDPSHDRHLKELNY